MGGVIEMTPASAMPTSRRSLHQLADILGLHSYQRVILGGPVLEDSDLIIARLYLRRGADALAITTNTLRRLCETLESRKLSRTRAGTVNYLSLTGRDQRGSWVHVAFVRLASESGYRLMCAETSEASSERLMNVLIRLHFELAQKAARDYSVDLACDSARHATGSDFHCQ